MIGPSDQFGWAVNPGDEITLSAWARTSTVATSSDLTIGCIFYSSTRNLSEGTGPGSDPPFTYRFVDTAWTFVTRTVFPPLHTSNTDFNVNMAQPYFIALRGGAPVEFFGIVQVDDAKLTIRGGVDSSGFEVSPDREFQVGIQFSGQTLKSYAHVHPLRSYEHPAIVVLT